MCQGRVPKLFEDRKSVGKSFLSFVNFEAKFHSFLICVFLVQHLVFSGFPAKREYAWAILFHLFYERAMNMRWYMT